jgi:pimeloyl-ACP methyl ester carboxylesterase
VGKHQMLTVPGDIKYHYVAKGTNTNPLMLFLHGFPEVGLLNVETLKTNFSEWHLVLV